MAYTRYICTFVHSEYKGCTRRIFVVGGERERDKRSVEKLRSGTDNVRKTRKLHSTVKTRCLSGDFDRTNNRRRTFRFRRPSVFGFYTIRAIRVSTSRDPRNIGVSANTIGEGEGVVFNRNAVSDSSLGNYYRETVIGRRITSEPQVITIARGLG